MISSTTLQSIVEEYPDFVIRRRNFAAGTRFGSVCGVSEVQAAFVTTLARVLNPEVSHSVRTDSEALR
jgi:hypothetical protein